MRSEPIEQTLTERAYNLCKGLLASISPVEPLGLDAPDAPTAIIREALADVADAYGTICNTSTPWLANLRELLPHLPPAEARLIALLAITRKAKPLLEERAYGLLEIALKAEPDLQQAIFDSQAEDDSELLEPC
jgi:hypothetical protein